jgi:hypothetical protein
MNVLITGGADKISIEVAKVVRCPLEPMVMYLQHDHLMVVHIKRRLALHDWI